MNKTKKIKKLFKAFFENVVEMFDFLFKKSSAAKLGPAGRSSGPQGYLQSYTPKAHLKNCLKQKKIKI